MGTTLVGAKTTIRAELSVKKKVKVPVGSRQRLRARKTKLMVSPVSNRILVMPRVGLAVELIIGQGFTRGWAYSVRNVNSEKVKVRERMAGPSCRQDDTLPGRRHAARSGPLSASPTPSVSPKCVGLSRASVLRSMPKTVCQVRSPTPLMAKITMPSKDS